MYTRERRHHPRRDLVPEPSSGESWKEERRVRYVKARKKRWPCSLRCAKLHVSWLLNIPWNGARNGRPRESSEKHRGGKKTWDGAFESRDHSRSHATWRKSFEKLESWRLGRIKISRIKGCETVVD